MTGSRIVFMVVGALLGFVFERLAFLQVTQARARWERMAPQDKIVFFAGILTRSHTYRTLTLNILATPDWINARWPLCSATCPWLALDSLKEQVRFYFPGAGCQP